MAKWQHRSTVYKVALGCMYFIFLVYALAFSIPTWWGYDFGKTISFFGLWVRCLNASDSGDFDHCGQWAFGDDGLAWMDGVRGVWVGGMFFYVVAVVYSMVENCCTDEDNKDYGLTGILAILAGLCGAAGVIVVAVKVEELNNPKTDYYWGYMLACIATGLTLILAIILLITRNVLSNEKSRDNRTADYVFAHKQPNPYAQEYTNQGYTRDDIPLANGVTYQHTPAAHPYTMYQDGYNTTNFPHARNQGVYGQPAKNPYGYYGGRPNQEPSDIGTAYTDLSNGYTSELINAEHTLSRTNVAPRGDFVRGGDYGKPDFPARNDYFQNGSRAY